MTTSEPPQSPPAGGPLVIGGTGGSGTRAVARILDRAGWYMGSHLNGAHDALDIAAFDWRWGPSLVASATATEEMRAGFEAALATHVAQRPGAQARWGWKHPQSYLLLGFLAERFADLRFIHVVRDGRDVALSRNDNQLRLYGDRAIGAGDPADPVRRIAFWAWANDRAREQSGALLPGRHLRVRLEDLCGRPEAETRRILDFAQAGDVEPLPVDEIRTPAALGRGRRADPELVRRLEAVAGPTLRRFGYAEGPGQAPT